MKPPDPRAHTTSVEQTQALAAALAGLCRSGDLLVLAGEMGAGKTAFAQGFARGLGIGETVTSPTFTIVREYQGEGLALHHLDVYRLDQLREVPELGVGEMLDEDAVMLVEWGDAVLPVLGDQYLEVRISFVETGEDLDSDSDDQRWLELSPRGSAWMARARVLAETVAPWAQPDTDTHIHTDTDTGTDGGASC